MITCIADGYCPRKPVLKLVSETHRKLEFDVVDKSFRKVGNEWVTTYESVTFEAWNEHAEYLAEKLDVGVELTATGRQETQTWKDKNTGETKSRKVFGLKDYKIRPRARQSDGHAESSGDARSTPQRAEPQERYVPRRESSHQANQAPRREVRDQASAPSGHDRGLPPQGEEPEVMY